ncbi:MAG: glutamate mutase L [Nitrospinae bacterium]|nr:glutamate mutase L [Nitrospinota bacterium]
MPAALNVIVATDCGSTTTKAILIEKQGDVYRQTYRGESPTTVEAPFEDVTRGVLNAFTELEELSGRRLLDGERLIMPAKDGTGADLYVSTSSAGGGLQMLVAGVVLSMTGESAQRCALGAGAIVIDVLASNDQRLPHEKIERIRQLRPDMILLAGGTDGGTISHVVELAEYIAAADPKPRFGMGYKLPVIYAGNKDARDRIQEVLHERMDLTITDNIRPTLEQENLLPARHAIHNLFLEHVMAQAPGYRQLMTWTSAPIMPTPAAVGRIMETVARQQEINLLGVDIGGATTDVFSVFEGAFNRTVSANLGMSYSIANVLAEAGLANIVRWVPFAIPEPELRNRIKNKMIRPTTIPQTLEELQIEQAIAREALRLAFVQHISLAVGLKGVQQQRSVSEAFEQVATGQSLIDMWRLDLIVGSGGILSHAPRRVQAMLMLIDAYQPLAVTALAVDSIFMMPHLGVLSTVSEQAATDVFVYDCLIPLGTCVAPAGTGRPGERCLEYTLTFADGRVEQAVQPFGELAVYPLPAGAHATLSARPARSCDLGEGRGRPVERALTGGEVGVIIDTRGRPLELPREDEAHRAALLQKWAVALGVYSD